MRITITPAAAGDLDEIWAYLNDRSPRAAEKTIDRITDGITLLAAFPLWFPLHGLSVRKLLVSPYLVFYTVTVNRVVVLRVLHGARDLSAFDLAW